MKKNIIKNLIAAIVTRILPITAVIIVISAAVSLAASDTLCEGLWKEFVENKTDEAKLVYKNVIEAAKGSDAGAKETAKKAAQRLEALGEKKDEGNKGAVTAAAGPKFVATANLNFLLTTLTVKNDQLYKKTRESLVLLFSDLIKENHEKYKLPQITLINFSGSMTPADTDLLIDFDADATFKKPEAALAGNMAGYNGFNLNWKSILVTCAKNEAEIAERYKKAGLLHENAKNPLEYIPQEIRRFLEKNNGDDIFSIYSENISEFAAANKLAAGYTNAPVEMKRAAIAFDGKRMVLNISGDREKIEPFIKFLEKISDLQLLPVSPIQGDNGFDFKIKLTDSENLRFPAENFAAALNKNFDNARGTAKYKACMANLRNVTSVAELYLMEHPKFARDEFKNWPVEKFASENYLKALPECQEGGKYRYAEFKNNGKNEKNSGEYQCSVHGSPVKTIEFKIVSVKNGEEKVVSQPRIRTLVYQEASITMGTEGKDEKEGGKNTNSADGLKFLKIGVKLSKDAETAKSKQILANMDISLTFRNGEAEKLSHFNLKIKAAEGSDDWIEVRPSQEIAGYKVYFKIK